MKTTTLSLLAAIFALTMSACSSTNTSGIRIGYSHATQIAKDPTLPGKGQAGACLPFARALHHKFEAAGIPSRMIVYSYETTGSSLIGGFTQPEAVGGIGARSAGCHIVVAYEDAGRTYIMDNESWSPKWVKAGTPQMMAQQMSGPTFAVHLARVVNDENSLMAQKASIAGLRMAAK